MKRGRTPSTGHHGLSYEDAVRYTMVGCNEPAFPGTVWFGGNTVNITRCLTDFLYREDMPEYGTFDEFYAEIEEYLSRGIDEKKADT